MLTVTPLAKADHIDKSSVSVGKMTQEFGSKKEITVAIFFSYHLTPCLEQILFTCSFTQLPSMSTLVAALILD